MLERKFINYNDIDYQELDEVLSSVTFCRKNNRKNTESLANVAVSLYSPRKWG